MIDASPGITTLIMFGTLLLLLLAGLPVVFALGGTSVMAVLLLWGPGPLTVTFHNAWALMNSYTLIAGALFIFMAVVLQLSGIADTMFRSIQLWAGGMNGGLAMTVVLFCTVMAAMQGAAGTGVVTMGLLALPIMLKLGYNKAIAMGPILTGGALANLIPPSLSFIIYGAMARVSIGRLFAGGIIPGFILSFLYVSYIGIRCYFQPHLGPALPSEERVGFKGKILSLKSLVLPAAIVIAVLGSIFLGIASPTEASSVGAAGALVSAAVNRKLNWIMIKEACYRTFKVIGMVMWILIGAMCFRAVYFGVGGPALARDFVEGLDVAPIIIIFLMQLSYMFLGCFLEDLSLLLISIPVYLPIAVGLGFDPVWFGVLYMVNIQMAQITPPFGVCLFYLRGVAPPEVTIGDIYRSIIPFLPLQLIVLLAVMFFPQLVLWLPDVFFG